jgi:hypothetical protein
LIALKVPKQGIFLEYADIKAGVQSAALDSLLFETFLVT